MYPSIISTFPTVSPTDRLNNPSHSSLENSQSSAIGQMQTFIGTSSSAVGTLIYDVRSPSSDGGGHIQSANKGGTGQTSYNKGDLLVASSSSVLTKLVAGADGQILKSNPSTFTGLQWSPNQTNKIAVSGSMIGATGGQNSVFGASFIGVTIPASTLGTSNAIRTKLNMFYDIVSQGSSSIFANVYYGGARIASVAGIAPTVAFPSLFAVIEHDLYANNSSNSQLSFLTVTYVNNANASTLGTVSTSTSSVNSAIDQTLTVEVLERRTGTDGSLRSNGYTVEKII